MKSTKRVDNPCPWCGTRCCKAETLDSRTSYEWACGSKDTSGCSRWQSPTCRSNEIDVEQLASELSRLTRENVSLRKLLLDNGIEPD